MSLHLNAKPGQIAETVLLPGDPLRAKWIAETFLEDYECYSDLRGMLGFTGTYKGKRVSVQGTGMGIPSAMIYTTELVREYGVKNLIRVGSAGSFQKEIDLMDIVIAMSGSHNSNLNKKRFGPDTFAPTADAGLFIKALKVAEEKGIPVKAGNVLSSDVFYDDDPENYKRWAEYGVLCVEMETAGLYTVAAQNNVKALAILTISDTFFSDEVVAKEDRENSFHQMVEIALGLI